MNQMNETDSLPNLTSTYPHPGAASAPSRKPGSLAISNRKIQGCNLPPLGHQFGNLAAQHTCLEYDSHAEGLLEGHGPCGCDTGGECWRYLPLLGQDVHCRGRW